MKTLIPSFISVFTITFIYIQFNIKRLHSIIVLIFCHPFNLLYSVISPVDDVLISLFVV